MMRQLCFSNVATPLHYLGVIFKDLFFFRVSLLPSFSNNNKKYNEKNNTEEKVDFPIVSGTYSS